MLRRCSLVGFCTFYSEPMEIVTWADSSIDRQVFAAIGNTPVPAFPPSPYPGVVPQQIVTERGVLWLWYYTGIGDYTTYRHFYYDVPGSTWIEVVGDWTEIFEATPTLLVLEGPGPGDSPHPYEVTFQSTVYTIMTAFLRANENGHVMYNAGSTRRFEALDASFSVALPDPPDATWGTDQVRALSDDGYGVINNDYYAFFGLVYNGDHPFRRGDVNGDSSYDVTDPVLILLHLFAADHITCEDAADTNDDGFSRPR